MKTSNKLLLVTSIIIISALTFYNFRLKAEYDKGEYKSRFYKMTKKNIDGFTSIENNASTLTFRIEYGNKYEIWLDNEISNKVKFIKNNNKLIIDFNKNYEKEDYLKNYNVIIICPEIENYTTNFLDLKLDPKTKDRSNSFLQGTAIIYGFNQDKLNLNINDFTNASLEHNKLDYLKAIIGDKESKMGILTLDSTNQINNFYFDLKGKSILNLKNPSINSAQFQLSDSADVSLSGRALKLLKN